MDDVASGSSNINPLALLFLLVMCVVILRATPGNAIRAILATAACVPLGQELMVAGLHLYFLRILILVGFVRLAIRHEIAGFKLERVDKLIIGCIAVGFICGLIRDFTAETFGIFYNELGVYLLIRLLMRGVRDPLGDFKILALLGVGIAICMLVESRTHKNPFYVLGGVPENTIIRDGRLRCQGPFRHPILAGTFGATLFPLALALWQQGEGRRDKLIAGLGVLAAMVISITSASSGPLMTLMAAFVGLGLWLMRNHMRFFRRGIVAAILALAVVMKAPVWFLIAKISDKIGGGGYYRSDLIDKFITHFDQWWLIGTSYTANWATAGIVLVANPNMVDITNYYVEQGVSGGILQLGIFLAVLVACFKICGRAARDDDSSVQERRTAWLMGVCLACHCTAFISISYFDQIQVFWFWLLAAIATIPAQALCRAEEESEAGTDQDFDEDRAAISSSI